MKIHMMTLGDLRTNCYLVYGDNSDTCIVIDPGYEANTILLKAKALGKTIEAILLTHGHFDHSGAVRDLAADTDCKVYICAADLSLPPRLSGGSVYYTDTYADEDSVELAGLTFRVLNTPGHTEGAVCLLCEDTMFSGDTLFAGTCGRTDLPGGSWAAMQKSLRRLAALETDYKVLPGHGRATTLFEEKQFNPYMQ